MLPQSLSTLTEEDRREDGEGDAPSGRLSPLDRENKTQSRLSLASWFGFTANNKDERPHHKSSTRQSHLQRGHSSTITSSTVSNPPFSDLPLLPHQSSTSSSFSSLSTVPHGSVDERTFFSSSSGPRPHRAASASLAYSTRTREDSIERGGVKKSSLGRGNFGGRLSSILGRRTTNRSKIDHHYRSSSQSIDSTEMAKRYGTSSSDSSEEERGRLLISNEEEIGGIEEENGEGIMNSEEKTRECPLCFFQRSESQFPRLIGCSHRCCRSCLITYLQLEVLASRVEISCPECTALIHPTDVRMLLRSLGPEKGPEMLSKYEEFSLRRYLVSDPDTRWCPAPDCGFAVIASSCAACPQLKCGRESCGTLFCYHCKDVWHDSETCDEARRTRGALGMMPSVSSNEGRRGILRSSMGIRRGSSRLSSEAMILKPNDIKACPRCRALIVKMDDGSCNHMVCTMCSTEFCWLCLKEISDLHYLSPTGCTFWGKKPWTKKKKLLWQVGTLIGAPLGIALIAGLSIPGIIFGVPVLVGRKVHHRFMHHSKVRRRLVTAACVAGSLVVSPVLAVMAVGVGVPILLAYVYGVVPLSLCRNGGCGWSLNDDLPDDVLWTGVSDSTATSPNQPGPSGINGGGVVRGNSTDGVDSVVHHPSGLGVSEVDKARTIGGGGDGVSLAPATSLHSGFSVCTARGKSFADSESCSNTTTSKRMRRPSCESGGVTSLNYEEASTRGLAGSQYHYDDKSVHTLGSQAPELMSCCDDVASTKALAGSVHDTKSLSGSVVVHEICDETQCTQCQGPSTSTGTTVTTTWWPHRRSVSSSRQNKMCRGGVSGGIPSSSTMDSRPDGGTLSEDDDEIVHSMANVDVVGVVNGGGNANNGHCYTQVGSLPSHSQQGPSSSSSHPPPPSTTLPSSSSSSHTTHVDPFGFLTLLDNMKQMVAADDADIDDDDVYRPEPLSRYRRTDSSTITREPTLSMNTVDPELGGVNHVSPRPSSSSTNQSTERGTTTVTAESTPTVRRSVRWLPSFLTKKSSKQ